MRLGFWQLSRAAQKTALQQAIENQSQLPPLTLAQLQSDPSAWAQTHRRVQLQGEWLSDQTVFLDNRAHHGRVGFWVMTPLRVQAGQVVWCSAAGLSAMRWTRASRLYWHPLWTAVLLRRGLRRLCRKYSNWDLPSKEPTHRP